MFSISPVHRSSGDLDLFGLAGGRPEEVTQVYHDRSPINKVNNISSPLIVLQGEDDKVVPPDQAEMIVDAVKRNGLRVEYLLFPGEGVRHIIYMSRWEYSLTETAAWLPSNSKSNQSSRIDAQVLL